MPPWDAGELPDAPRFRWRSLLWSMIGPGMVMGAAAIGGGEWLAGPQVSARYGPSLLWVASVSILFQVLYNIEISRYTLYTGEPIFTGKFRTLPGPMFWLVFYLMLDWGSLAPYLATNAAAPLFAVIFGRLPLEADPPDWWALKILSSVFYGLCAVPLIFGGKIYNSLKVVMSLKLVIVLGFLLFLAVLYAYPSQWGAILQGFTRIGNVPVVHKEDWNENGVLDPGEDVDGDGRLDEVEPILKRDANGKVIEYVDTDGDGIHDGANVENAFVSLFTKGRLPEIDWTLIAMIAGLAAIAGNGGLTNTPISNFTRDQGWGMGSRVGAIPSLIGGHGITLSHVGCVFDVNEETLPRWRRWYRHVMRDQLFVWMLACFMGVGLPSILSVGFLPRGAETKDDSNTATLTAEGVQNRIENPPDDVLASRIGLASLLANSRGGQFFWSCTLFCGFLVLITSMATTMDGFIRRWLDVFWTASPRLRELDTSYVGKLYFLLLIGYCLIGFAIIWSPYSPKKIFQMATMGYNFALAFSSWHALYINTTLLPRQLRPNWFVRIGLVLGGCYFICLGIMSVLKWFQVI